MIDSRLMVAAQQQMRQVREVFLRLSRLSETMP
jgi:hypothetical protein